MSFVLWPGEGSLAVNSDKASLRAETSCEKSFNESAAMTAMTAMTAWLSVLQASPSRMA